MADEKLTIRVATPEDASALVGIYAHYVEETAVSFEYETPSVEEFRGRIENTLKRFPYLVAELDGEVAGYAYAGYFKPRTAYDHSAETTIYLSQCAQGKGIGRTLYMALENVLLLQNVYNLYACIATTPREDDAHLTDGSPRFHERMGYTVKGSYDECAYKYGQWYNMVWMGKKQGPHVSAPAEPDSFVPFPQLDAVKVRKMITAALEGESEAARRTKDSAGAVVFRETAQGTQVLMIQMKQSKYSFPKGHIEAGETREMCALREIQEETGVLARIIPGFCGTVPSVRPGDTRSVYFLLGEAVQEDMPRGEAWDEEIDDALWVNADEAADMVSFEADKAVYLEALEAYRVARG